MTTINITRRNMIRTSLMASAGIGLAACNVTGTSVQTITAQVVSDANLIATGLAAVVPGLASVSAAVMAKVNAYAVQAEAAAQSMATAVSAAVAKPSVTTIEGAVNGTISALADLPLPPPFSTYLTAAATLLPLVEAAVGLATPAGVAPGEMSIAEARRVLSAV